MATTKQTVLTREGLKNLENELEHLKSVTRKEIAEKIKTARGFGDLSENSEYDDAKREQQENEAEKHRIEEILKNYVLIDENMDTDVVRLGQCVTLYDYDFEEEIEYYLVGSTEADPLAGKISNESPVGKALIGLKVGQTAAVETPSGVFKYKVLEIIQ
jgi:transcription elongation factor GreA